MKPRALHAWTASLTELACGTLLLLGLLTPLACGGIVGTMLVAWITNHRKNGFFIFRPGEGHEYLMTLAPLALALGTLGPGGWSVDNALEIVTPHGAGLARHLHEHGVEVLEVPRPDRRLRRQRGKSDPIDAKAAARTVVAGNASGAPKFAAGPIEAIRMLRVARAVKAKTAAANTLLAVLVTAPEPLRSQLRQLSTAKLIDVSLRLRPDPTTLHHPVQAAKLALRSIATRARALDAEARGLKKQLDALTVAAAPSTSAIFGLGPDTVSALLVAIGDNPDRLRSEAAFAPLCGVAPILASSGKTNRTACIAATAPATSPAHRGRRAPALRPTKPQLRHTPNHSGQIDARDHPMPKALPRPRSLHRPARRLRRHHHLTIYRSVPDDLLQRCPVELGVGHQPLERGVLPLQILQPLRVVGLSTRRTGLRHQ
jgi:transposase